MTPRAAWFVAGLILLALFSMYAPRVAGTVVILVAIVLAIRLAQMKLI